MKSTARAVQKKLGDWVNLSRAALALYASRTQVLVVIGVPHRCLTDSNGQPVWQWAITGFGELEPTTAHTGWIRERLGTAGPISNTSAVSFNLRYPGQQFDSETGLFYNHHRTYDPYLTIGYTEADPLGLAAGWNRFGYANENPMLYTDPTGLWVPWIHKQLTEDALGKVCTTPAAA